MSDVMRHKPSKKMYYVFYKSLVALQDVFFLNVCVVCLFFLFGKCETSLCVLVVSGGFFFIETLP